MATLADRLKEAEQAQHDLQIGRSVVRVRDANGEEITYTTANRSSLAAYIADLKRQLGSTGCLGPMRPFF